MQAASTSAETSGIPAEFGSDQQGRLGWARGSAVWVATFGLVACIHAVIALAWLAQPLPASVGLPTEEPAFDLDLASPSPSAAPEGDGAGPIAELPPDVPAPEIELAAASGTFDPPEPPPPQVPEPPETPRIVELPPGRAETWVDPISQPSSPDLARARAEATRRSEAVRARAEAARERQEAERERRRREGAVRASGGASPRNEQAGRSAVPGSGASMAASAAWRGQIVGILRGRFAGGTSGMASVTFSVTRGGQIGGARLTASSGNPRLDAAALAVFRGAVPAPPAGYVGPLSFNIRLGVR